MVRSLLAATLLSSTGLVAMPAAAQTAAPAAAVPAPPAGGYGRADGTRTTDYNAALESWRIVVSAAYGNDGLVNPRRPWEIHGIHVAGAAAGVRNAGERMFGNAFGANIVSVTANFSAGGLLWWKDQILGETTVSTSRENIVDTARTGLVRIVTTAGVRARRCPTPPRWPRPRRRSRRIRRASTTRSSPPPLLAVFSAGNGGGVHASIDAVTPLNDMRLRSNWLSVLNYGANGTAAHSTSVCGQPPPWCVAGPRNSIISGVNLYTVDTAAIRARYPPAMFPGIYSATTVAALNNAATSAWINVRIGPLLMRAGAAHVASVHLLRATTPR